MVDMSIDDEYASALYLFPSSSFAILPFICAVTSRASKAAVTGFLAEERSECRIWKSRRS